MSGDDGSVHDVVRGGEQHGVPHEGAHDGVEEVVGGVGQQLLLRLVQLTHGLTIHTRNIQNTAYPSPSDTHATLLQSRKLPFVTELSIQTSL
jgi:hypothetical protein